jgi:hypothetical protein
MVFAAVFIPRVCMIDTLSFDPGKGLKLSDVTTTWTDHNDNLQASRRDKQVEEGDF